MATTTTTTRRPRSSSSSRSFGARMTAKVGPLPVWAWALAILVVGYLIYRHTSSSSSSSDTSSSTDTSSTDQPAPPDTSGTPGPDNTGGGSADAGAGGLNDALLSQLGGFGNSIDALTAAVLASEAFVPGSGDAGSGSSVPNGVPTISPGFKPAQTATGAHGATTKTTTAAAKTKPAPTLVSEHGQGGGFTPTPAKSSGVRYFTYAPGKAPKGKKGEEAPASVKGKKLHFAPGRGYYYA